MFYLSWKHKVKNINLLTPPLKSCLQRESGYVWKWVGYKNMWLNVTNNESLSRVSGREKVIKINRNDICSHQLSVTDLQTEPTEPNVLSDWSTLIRRVEELYWYLAELFIGGSCPSYNSPRWLRQRTAQPGKTPPWIKRSAVETCCPLVNEHNRRDGTITLILTW